MAVPEGYPIGYRLGFDMILWLFAIFESLIIVFFFIVRIRRSTLINKKELYFGMVSMNTGIMFTHIFFQLGYLIPEEYHLYIPLGYISMALGLTILSIFWEKNLMELRRIPTILGILLSIIMIFNFIYNLFFQKHIVDFMTIFSIIGNTVTIFLLMILAFQLLRRVIGFLKIRALFLIISIFFFAIGYSLDTFYIYSIIPDFPTFISPISVIISASIIFYVMIGISDKLLTFYKQIHMCIIHKGIIPKENAVYICPSCDTIYCVNCFEKVIKLEGCWNCNQQEFASVDSIPIKALDEKDSFNLDYKNK